MRSLKSLFFLVLLSAFTGSAAQNMPSYDTVRLAVFADLHVSPGSVADENLSQAIENVNRSGYDFVIVAGDISNVGSDAELENVFNKLRELTVPYYLIPGNHETNWSESACQTINKLWKNDRFVFEAGDYIFIGYSTGPYLKMGDGVVKKEDIIWLEQELEKRYKPGKKVVSIAHYPLGEGLSNYKDVTSVLKKYNTVIHINGHHHTFKLRNYDGIPGFMAMTMLGKPSDNGIYNSVVFTPDSIRIARHQEKNGYKEELGWVIPQNGDRSEIGEPMPGEYQEPMTGGSKVVPFSYQDSASVFTGPCFPTASTVVYGTSLGQLKCLDINTKRVLWATPEGPTIYSTPFVGAGVVVVGHVDGEVAGYNRKNGKKIRSFNIGSPVVGDGVADENGYGYIGGSFGEFVKFNCKNGRVEWKKKIGEGLIQAKPVISDNKLIFGCWDKYLYCVDRNDGSVIWKWTNGSPQKLYSPGNVVPAVSNGKVFIVAPDRKMTAISLTDGKELWRTNLHTVRESMCLSRDGERVYAKTMNDVLICVSTVSDDYQVLWTADCKYGYEHTPCPPVESKNGLVFLSNRRGQVFAVEGKTGAVKWSFDAGNSAANKIVEGPDGRVWITLIEGRILSIEPMEIL